MTAVGTFARGLKSVYRNPARSAIIVVLLGVCLTFSLAMLAVRTAARSQVEKVKGRVGNYAEVRRASQAFFDRYMRESEKSQAQRQREARSMSPEEASRQRAQLLVDEGLADELARSEYIRTYDKFLTASIDVPEMENPAIMPVFEKGLAEQAARVGIELTESTFAFTGNTDAASLADFREGRKALIEGRYYDYFDYLERAPVVLAERNLAQKNGLSVGDGVKVRVKDRSGRSGDMYVRIIGIYETREAERESGPLGFNPFGNTFYAPLSLVQDLNNTPGYVDSASYYFDNVDSTKSLLAFFSSLEGSERCEITTDYADYQALADPLTKTGNASTIGLGGSLGACVLILLLSMLLVVRGRMKELGVLKAVGSADRQILAQFAVEVAVLCMAAMIIASLATAVIGQSLGEWLMEESNAAEAAPAEQSVEEARGGGAALSALRGSSQGKYIPPADADSDIVVMFGSRAFLYACLMLMLICLLGMVIPVVGVTRLRPAQVLRME